MPATGRSYYPNVPGSLEEALAGSVAAGTSPWAPILMMNARHERQQAMDAVNETQAQQFLLGLQGQLKQTQLQGTASAIGEGLRGGHAVGPLLGQLNSVLGATIPQGSIDTEQALSTAAQAATVGKTLAEGDKAGTEAGVRPDLSSVGASIGLPQITGTPTELQKQGLANQGSAAVANINAGAKRYTADHKTTKATAPKQDFVQVSGPYGAVTHYLQPGELSPDTNREIEKATQNAKVVTGNAAQSNVTDPTQDTAQQDPGWAAQQDALIKSRFTNPVFVKRDTQYGKKGKLVEVDDPAHPGHRTTKFVSDPHQ